MPKKVFDPARVEVAYERTARDAAREANALVQAADKANETDVQRETRLRAGVRNFFESQRKHTQEKIDQFSKEFSDRPLHALEWGVEVVAAAARNSVAKWGLENKCEHVWQMRNVAHERMMNHATAPCRSTSSLANLVHVETGAAWARAYETLEAFVKSGRAP